MSEVIYHVPSISCGHCVHTIQTEVSELAGVSSVVASLDSKQVRVMFDPPATEEQIRDLLTEIHYPPSN